MSLVLLLRSPAPPPPAAGATIEQPITTADTFDLKTEGTTRISHRRATTSDGRIGPRFSRQIDPRAVREFVVSIENARTVELWRLKTIWNNASQGTSPLDYPERVHGLGLGDLIVVIVDPEYVRRQFNTEFGSFEIRLREWRG